MDIIAFNRADTILKRLPVVNANIEIIQNLLLADKLTVRISASSNNLLSFIDNSSKDIKAFLQIAYTSLTTEEEELKKELAAL